jgi:hypothetical protein
LGGGAGDEREGGGIGDWDRVGVMEGEAEACEEKLEFSGRGNLIVECGTEGGNGATGTWQVGGEGGGGHPPPPPRAASYEQYTHRVTRCVRQVGFFGGGRQGKGTGEGGRWLIHRANVLLMCC